MHNAPKHKRVLVPANMKEHARLRASWGRMPYVELGQDMAQAGDPPPPPTSWRKVVDWYVRRRFSILFFTLLLTMIASPLAAELHLRSGPVEIFLALSLGAATLGLAPVRWRNLPPSIVVIIALLRFLGRWLHLDAISAVAAALWVVLTIAAVYGALRFALKGKAIDSEHLSAALSAYLLAGLLFGFVCYQVEELRAGSYAVGGSKVASGQFDLQTGIYFSFITLATLGYGDIVPLTPTARGLATFEALVGQFYLAVLVARLVGAAANRE